MTAQEVIKATNGMLTLFKTPFTSLQLYTSHIQPDYQNKHKLNLLYRMHYENSYILHKLSPTPKSHLSIQYSNTQTHFTHMFFVYDQGAFRESILVFSLFLWLHWGAERKKQPYCLLYLVNYFLKIRNIFIHIRQEKKKKGRDSVHSIFHILLMAVRNYDNRSIRAQETVVFSIHTRDSPSWKVGFPCQQHKTRWVGCIDVCTYAHTFTCRYIRTRTCVAKTTSVISSTEKSLITLLKTASNKGNTSKVETTKEKSPNKSRHLIGQTDGGQRKEKYPATAPPSCPSRGEEGRRAKGGS